MKRLIEEYENKKREIKNRLKEFKKAYASAGARICEELCFCLLTPRSKAVVCDKAVRKLKKAGLLFKGSRKAIRSRLRGVRFPNNKAGYLLAARKSFPDIGLVLGGEDVFKMREWLARNIKGLGYKEASHFLRNIGLGEDLAILDAHILKNLKRYGVIKKIPSSLSRKKYLDIEDKMRGFSEKIGIPLGELDLLFWSKETGVIFK